MPNLQINVNTRRPYGRQWGALPGVRTTSGAALKQPLRKLVNFLEALASGAVQSDGVSYGVNDTQALGDAAFAGPAVGALVLSAGSGAVGATIDGQLTTVTWATSDVASMTALCAAVNAATANGTNQKVSMANSLAVITMGTPAAGITVDIFGVRFTATAAAAVNFGDFDRSSGVAATIATALAQAINRHPSLSGRARAVANSAVVYVGLLEQRLPGPTELIANAGTGITITTATPAASAIGLIFAADWGVIGNCVTVVASGTGMTYATANAGKLGGGTGGAAGPRVYLTP